MKGIITIFILILLVINTFAYEEVINLWEDQDPPYDNGQKAELHIFLPDKDSTGRAIVICPGGGYAGLASEHEGTDWASYFNEQGISIFVLLYRLPEGDRRVPISDAEEAIKLVRNNSDKWKINPEDVGIMGFSEEDF